MLLSALNTFPPRQTHLVPILPAIAILSALGLVAVADRLAAMAGARRTLAAAGAIMTTLALVVVTSLHNYFVTMPRQYRPNLENTIAFAAVGLSSPRTILYAYDDPAERTFVPWVIQNMSTRAAFATVSAADLQTDRFSPTPGGAYTLYWRKPQHEAALAYLNRLLNVPVTPTVYRGTDGSLTGFSYDFAGPP
ncbi:MAG: hypothetical protein ACR2OO_08795 [Thermomicrobiales bacterium]